MRAICFIVVVSLAFPALGAGRYEKKKAGECVSFDAMCLDMEAIATIASEHEKVVQQCKLDIAKQKEQMQTISDGIKASLEAEIKQKDKLIEILKTPPPPDRPSIWPYIAIGGGGIILGAITTTIIFLVK